MSQDFVKFLLVFVCAGLGMAGIYWGLPESTGAGRVGLAFLGGAFIVIIGLVLSLALRGKADQGAPSPQKRPGRATMLPKASSPQPIRGKNVPKPSLSEAGPAFFEAVMKDDSSRMKTLLDSCPDLLNYQNPESDLQSPLLIAVAQNREKATTFLLERGANPDITEPKQGAAPLHWAAYLGHAAMIPLLHAHRADLGKKEMAGQTPLHWAARKNQVRAVQALLKAGADINAIDNRGATPLMYAIEHGALQAVELLLKSKARTDIVDQWSESATTMAEGKPALMAILKKFT